MNRLLLFIIFIPHLLFGQGEIQHEPERLFFKFLNENGLMEFIQENKLKKISFFRDSIFSSSLEFDINGNSVREIGMENDYVRETIRKYDNQNREIESKDFTPNGEFSYGQYNLYNNDTKLTYSIEDSLLLSRNTFLESENIYIYTAYEETGEIRYKTVNVKDNQKRWLLEAQFDKFSIYKEYVYEYVGSKKFVTKIQYDRNGTKVSEKRHLDEIKLENRLEHYTDEDERLFRIDYFNQNGKLKKMKLFDKNGQSSRLETSVYNKHGYLKKKTEEYIERSITIIYDYKYSENNWIEEISKDINGEKEIFRFEYQIYE